MPTPREALAINDLDQARAALYLRLHAQARISAPDTRVSCLWTESEKEPSERLALLVSDQGLGMVRAARCTFQHGGRMYDTVTGSPAVVLAIRSLRVFEPGSIEAQAMFTLGGLWCGGGLYRVNYRLGRWEVTDPPPALSMVC